MKKYVVIVGLIMSTTLWTMDPKKNYYPNKSLFVIRRDSSTINDNQSSPKNNTKNTFKQNKELSPVEMIILGYFPNSPNISKL